MLASLFLDLRIVAMGVTRADVQRHIAPDAALPLSRKTGLGVDDGVTALGGLDGFGVLCLQESEVRSPPDPDVSEAKRRFISSRVRRFDSGYRAQTVGMVMTLRRVAKTSSVFRRGRRA